MELDKSDKQYILDELEDLRSGNTKLREWGENSEREMEKYYKECAEMEDKLIDVCAKLEQAYKTIAALQGSEQHY